MNLISIEEFENDFIYVLAEKVQKSTVQLFRINSEEGIVAHGCGTLFQFQMSYFIITAAHNFQGENISELKIRVNNHFLEIKGEILFANSDKVDIAVVKINDDLAKELLKSSFFVGIEHIYLNPHQKIMGEKNNDLSDWYFLFGYPGRKTKQIYGSNSNWEVQAFFLCGYLYKIDTNKLIEEGYDVHIFFNKRQKYKKLESRQKVQLPKLKGMSGCGLWDIRGYDIKTGEPKYKLVGIFTEINFDVFISTKIDFAIELIRQEFNLLQLPKSVIQINWKKS